MYILLVNPFVKENTMFICLKIKSQSHGYVYSGTWWPRLCKLGKLYIFAINQYKYYLQYQCSGYNCLPISPQHTTS